MEQARQSKWMKALPIGLVVLIGIDIYTRFYAVRHQPQIPIPVVVIAKPKSLAITPYVTQTGSIVAYNAVNLVARIEGYLDTIDFVNTGLDASTGTMEFRALLPNQKYALIPGLFAQIRVALGAPTQQLTVPDTAILYDQIGSYLLLVDKKNTVVLQRVVLGDVDQGQRAVIKGLRAEDQVIISGLQNATPGHQVTPQYEQKQS